MIIGTPTYAIPTWMVKSYPDVIATTVNGRGIYGKRQIIDITHSAYRFYAERIIRELMKRTARAGLLEQPDQCVGGFPGCAGTINGSLGAEFEKFQRSLVDEFLSSPVSDGCGR